MTKQSVVAVAASLALAACAIADHYQAQSRMEKSKEAYQNCVALHLKDPGECDPLKAIYEQDKDDFEKT
jgi:uncharacterized low-complexity protein